MIQYFISDGGGFWVVHSATKSSPCAEVARRSASSFPVTPKCPWTQSTYTGASRDCIHSRRWSQMNASGESYSLRDVTGAMTCYIMWIAALESVWISSAAVGGEQRK